MVLLQEEIPTRSSGRSAFQHSAPPRCQWHALPARSGFPHIHHNCLANAVLIFQRLLQRHKNIGWLDDGDFDQPLFLAALRHVRQMTVTVQQRGNLGLLFILAVVKRGDLHQQPLFILL
jgi:hypothetical protein